MILVDTSVWIDHLRRGNAALVEALEREDVLTHPFVIGELGCGQFKNRREMLGLMSALPSAVVASDEEVMVFIERWRLMGKGIGFIDAHLLASTSLTAQAILWTLDARLSALAKTIRVPKIG